MLGTDHALEDRRQARSTTLTALMAKTIVGSAGAQGGARPIPRVRLAAWLILCCYLAAALVLTWRLWADPASRTQIVAANGTSHDVRPFAWFLRYDATAVAHGHLPALVTTALNAPRGINLMWNTSLLLPGVVLAPVTMLAGPQVTLAILLTLAFAGSAASLFVVLRRWGPASPRRRWAVRSTASPRRCGWRPAATTTSSSWCCRR